MNTQNWKEKFNKFLIYKEPNISLEEYIENLLQQQRDEIIEEIENVMRDYEYDKEAHIKGTCSHTLALCSAIEQQIKLEIKLLIKKVADKIPSPLG